jgi:hypothetical protein
MRYLIPALLVLFAMSVRAATLNVSFTDGDGRTCNAEIVIDDDTHHAVAVKGADYEGREYSFNLQAFTATEWAACGSKMYYYSFGGCWYMISPSQEGVICGVYRYGGPGYSSAMYSYRLIDPASQSDTTTDARPEHN